MRLLSHACRSTPGGLHPPSARSVDLLLRQLHLSQTFVLLMFFIHRLHRFNNERPALVAERCISAAIKRVGKSKWVTPFRQKLAPRFPQRGTNIVARE